MKKSQENVIEHIKKVKEEFGKSDFGETSLIMEGFIINLTDSDNEVSNAEIGSSESSDEHFYSTLKMS